MIGFATVFFFPICPKTQILGRWISVIQGTHCSAVRHSIARFSTLLRISGTLILKMWWIWFFNREKIIIIIIIIIQTLSKVRKHLNNHPKSSTSPKMMVGCDWKPNSTLRFHSPRSHEVFDRVESRSLMVQSASIRFSPKFPMIFCPIFACEAPVCYGNKPSLQTWLRSVSLGSWSKHLQMRHTTRWLASKVQACSNLFERHSGRFLLHQLRDVAFIPFWKGWKYHPFGGAGFRNHPWYDEHIANPMCHGQNMVIL